MVDLISATYVLSGVNLMETEENIGKSIFDLIMEEVFSIIAKQEFFDVETIDSLESLWRSGDLIRYERVIQAIKPNPEE